MFSGSEETEVLAEEEEEEEEEEDMESGSVERRALAVDEKKCIKPDVAFATTLLPSTSL